MAVKEILSTPPVIAQILPWQEPLVQQLVELKKRKKLPHALLIELQTSVDSIGFGWQLVSALLCESETATRPCGECKSCHLMSANSYPDFTYTTLLENEKTNKLNKDIKIDQIRKLIHQISLTNSLNAGKYALIYPAEKMNQSAANSLLKTLEEPSSDSTLVLLTHHSSRLPITIRSRCQKWSIPNPDKATSQQWLKQQGLEQSQIEGYLKLANDDAQLALEMAGDEYQLEYQNFSQLLERYLQDNIDAATLVNSLKNPVPSTIRNIIRNELLRYIQLQLKMDLTQMVKDKLSGLLELQQKANWILQVEDNNLNLLLQLEDVLISMKQIINRG